jgi:MFS family permease
VQAETGGLSRLWWLFPLAVLVIAAFGWWEVRTVRRRGQPLLDPRLVRTSGYPAGAALALVYFMGFTGMWLIFALFFQHGLAYSPLHSGLAVTPFALGLAVSAVIAGRLVPRVGRWLTVGGLAGAGVGLVAAAFVLRVADADLAAWAAAGPLLVAGLGAGMVTSPNTTLTLAAVPSRMAGAASGGLQAVQRIGSAIGTAVLVSIFYQVLGHTRGDFTAAVFDTLLAASGFMLLALVLAVWDLIQQRAARAGHPAPVPWPRHHHHHF